MFLRHPTAASFALALPVALALSVAIAAFGALAFFGGGLPGIDRSRTARAQPEPPTFFVNTTVDEEITPEHCTTSDEGVVSPCPLRAALERASRSDGVVRARWCEQAEEDEPCLGEDDPNHDAALGKWRFPVGLEFSHVVTSSQRGGTVVDFAADIPGWSGPADNRVVLDAGLVEQQEWVLAVEALNFTLRGFDLTGAVQVAALTLRLDSANGLIEGLAVYDVLGGSGYHFRDDETSDNRLIGSWCGVRSDGAGGMVAAPVEGSCVDLTIGASGNTIGGTAPGEGNRLCNASDGVRVTSGEGRGNLITGNQIGDVPEANCANFIGVWVEDESPETRIIDNDIVGNARHGVLIDDFTFLTHIEGNRIGSAEAPNGGFGVRINNLVKRTAIVSNTISHNEEGGVRISGGQSLQNVLRGNSIFAHGGNDKAIIIDRGSNGDISPPTFSTGDGRIITGRACSLCFIEFFSDPNGEALVFEGGMQVSNTGIFRFEKPNGFTHGLVTATSIDPEAGSSMLSLPFRYRDDPTPTPLGPPPTHTPRPPATATPEGFAVGAFLPWLGNSGR